MKKSLRGSTVAALGALVFVLAGCGGGDGEATATAPGDPSQEPSVAPTPRLADEVGAAKESKLDSCQAADDGWVARGTVANPTESAVDYLVVVSLQDTDQPAGNQTAGLNWTLVEGVGAGATQEWEVSVAVKPTNASCILRVTRAAAGAREQ